MFGRGLIPTGQEEKKMRREEKGGKKQVGEKKSRTQETPRKPKNRSPHSFIPYISEISTHSEKSCGHIDKVR